jgi:hypothetical protein
VSETQQPDKKYTFLKTYYKEVVDLTAVTDDSLKVPKIEEKKITISSESVKYDTSATSSSSIAPSFAESPQL